MEQRRQEGMAGEADERRAPRWPSRSMRLVSRVLATEPKLMADPDAFRAAYQNRVYPCPAPIPAALRIATRVTTGQFDGRAVYTITPREATSRWHVLYLHGGGYIDEVLPVHWEIILQVVRHLGATVTMPLYPLAPEHTHREGNGHVERFYREFITTLDPTTLVVMGDSAGGGMALAQAMRWRDAGLPLPARLVLFAPWTNVLPVNPKAAELESRDVVLATAGGQLAGRWWAGADDPADPDVSPLYGDPAGLPPVDIFQGTADLLWPDSALLAQRIAQAGGEVHLYEYDEAVHVFVAASFTPEARDAYRRIAATLHGQPHPAGRAVQVVTAPPAVLSRQVTNRLRARSVPWIHHLGVRARLEMATRARRLPRAS